MSNTVRSRQSLSKDRFPLYFGGARIQIYQDHRGHSVRSIAWNPFGTAIATGSADKTLRVWNPDRPNARFSTELKGHTAPIEKVAFNPVKQAELCSVSNDGTVKLWDVRNNLCVGEFKGLGEAFTLAWAPDGSSLIVGNKTDKLFIIQPGQSTPVASYQQPTQTNQIAFCWSGKKAFVTTGDGKTRILSYPDLKPLLLNEFDEPPSEFKLSGHTASCLTTALHPAARYLATGGSESLISLWDTKDWICQRTLTGMTGPVRSLSFSFDGSYISAGSEDGKGVRIWHTESGDEVYARV
ncbi:THO complex subunit 3 [Ceratocystis lukuohia]|uniref:THO complex subunit 3 n=1 Tax=Ceratocystis lukuohia TaxID=2019550 RepID=A0ABR4MCD5_9PEZI